MTPTQKRPKKKYNLKKLENKETKQKWTNRLNVLNESIHNVGTDLEDKWEDIKKNIHTVAKEVLGFKEEQRKYWIRNHTWKLIRQREKERYDERSEDLRCKIKN